MPASTVRGFREILDAVKLLLVSPEVAPFVKTGAVAEGVSALARALAQRGHDVTVTVPRYRAGEPDDMEIVERLPAIRLLETSTPGSGYVDAQLFDAKVASGPGPAAQPVKLLLVELPGFHEEHGIWGRELTDATDNARRFALFSRAVLHELRRETEAHVPFDIVHVHDWPGALIPYLLREARAEVPHTRSVLTIHNLVFQGVFPVAAIGHLALDGDHSGDNRLGFFDRMSFLKGGIASADAVVTVSPSYAREICTRRLGEGLDRLLASRPGGVHGIANGIDVELWDPATDPHLVANYDGRNPGNKALCKAELVRELGFGRPDAPLVVSLGRVCGQKGSDLLAQAAEGIALLGANVVVAGTGEADMVTALRSEAVANPGRFAYVGFAEEKLAHRIIAAGDVLVMPSRFEPCGIVQMYGQRYGTLPIAFRTGGLADTIVDLDAEPARGSGILEENGTAGGLVSAVARGLRAITSDEGDSVRFRIMSLPVGWGGPVQRYGQLYKQTRQARRA